MTDTTLAPPTDNGIVHVGGYGDMKPTTATNIRANFNRRRNDDVSLRAVTQDRIDQLEAELAEVTARLKDELADQRAVVAAVERSIDSLDKSIASLDIALGETTAPKGTAKRQRRSQGHTEGDGGTA